MKPKIPKWVLLILVVAFGIIVVPIVWLAIGDYHYFRLGPAARAERASLIVYAVVKHDTSPATFVIREVWKDERKSHAALIGTQIYAPVVPNDQVPDAVIVFYEKRLWDSHHLDARSFAFVSNGQIEGFSGVMTLEQYKKACGL